MPISNSSPDPQRTERWAAAALVLLGVALFLFQHFTRLGAVPGFHFDEAWSANLAADLAGGGPARTQSPYTRPWSQLLAAAAFSVGGVSVFVFRLTQVLSATAGIALLALAVSRAGFRPAALLLPLAIACLPGLAANHRFAIEMTGFHVLAFGLLALGVELRARKGETSRAYFLMAAAAIFGVTSHILFLAPLLGLLAALVLGGTKFLRMDRLFLMLVSLTLLPFFLQVTTALPAKGKGIALLALGVGIFVWALAGAKTPEFSSGLRKKLSLALGIACVPFLFNSFVFADGSWFFLIVNGGLVLPFFVAIAGIAAFLVIFRAHRDLVLPPEAKFWVTFTLATAVASGALMLKAAPRYYEIPMLMIAVAYAFAIASFEWKKRLVLGGFVGALTTSFFLLNYLLPGVGGFPDTPDRDVKFLAYKDSSRDFLYKTKLTVVLASYGCRAEDVKTYDPRLREVLTFLGRGDWPALSAGECKRRAERAALAADAPPDAERVGDFLVWGEK